MSAVRSTSVPKRASDTTAGDIREARVCIKKSHSVGVRKAASNEDPPS